MGHFERDIIISTAYIQQLVQGDARTMGTDLRTMCNKGKLLQKESCACNLGEYVP